MISMRLEGLENLTASMTKVADAVDKDKIEPILLEGAKELQKEARQQIASLTNRKTGRLLRSPKGKLLKRSIGRPAVAIAAIDRKIAPHAHLVVAHRDFWSPVANKAGSVNSRIQDRIGRNIDKAWR